MKTEPVNVTYFKNWPLDMIGQFPMTGTKHLYLTSNSLSELNLLRTALVYMIPINKSWSKFDVEEWSFTNKDDYYLGGYSQRVRLYERIMLPGKYKMDEHAVYLFADPGRSFSI